MLESRLHTENSFATLTYDEENFPLHGSLNYRDAQLFFKRARKVFGPFRFFVAGEYGDESWRPHWHALLFGLRPDDMRKYNGVYAATDLFRSEELERCWGKGRVVIGEVTWESARYCASYTTKKITGAKADEHYRRVDPQTGEFVYLEPEMARMSLKPGIGQGWIDRYFPEVLTHKAVIINGQKRKIPPYFVDRIEELDNDVGAELRYELTKEVKTENSTRHRLAVREQCALAKNTFFSKVTI